MKKAIVAFALQEEVVPVIIPGFEVYTILTKITKVQAAFRLTKAIFELQPDFVLNVGTAGTLTYSVGDIFSATHFIDRDSAKQNFTSVSSEVQTTPLLSLPSIVGGQVSNDTFIVNTG
ncbi:MAG: nucleosidase, partial [Alloprevotella tannerae]|nr:nucleosidase [Alloprevotella tannerae]